MNHEYKSDVFSMLLQDQANALDIYNALNGTHYDDPSAVEIQTLAGGISLTVRNDASFIIDSYMNVYEHQSTFNPNMPLRNLLYITKLLERHLKNENLYSRKQVRIPNIRCVVFYNGTDTQPEVRELFLSDAYIHKDGDPDVEVRCTVYNINKGNNEKLLKACKVLDGYMYFVNQARFHMKSAIFSDNPEGALQQAIDDCISNSVMEDFFRERREEILKVIMLDWTYERRIELEKKESEAIGEAKGARGIIKSGRKHHFGNDIILSDLMESLSLSEDKAKAYLAEFSEQQT